MRTMQFVGLVLILVGLLFVTNVLSMVTVVVDTTKPTLTITSPKDGETITVSQLPASVNLHYKFSDDVGVVKLAIITDYGAAWELGFGSGFAYYEGDYPVAGIPTEGSHKVTCKAVDAAGNAAEVTITFTIQVYRNLQGDWYVNDQKVTSPTQTIYVKTTIVTFTFQKTVGVDDSKISCWVEEGGTKILTLSLADTTNHVWTGSYTFANGKHALTLKASDGTSTVTMSIANLQVGETWELPHFNISQLLGFALIVVGVVLALQRKTV
jgi:hypothetical protein